MSQYLRLAKDSDARFDFETQGSMSRDYLGSRRKKQGGSGKRGKKSGGKKKDRDEIGFIAGGLPSGELAHVVPQVSQKCPFSLSL